MRLKTGLKGSGAPLVGLVFFFGGWELLVRALQIKAYVLVPPSRALRHIAHYPGFYWHNLRPTLWEAFLGFALALMVGSAVGAAMAHSRFIERAVLPIAVLIQVTPIVAYAAALVIWLGFGLRPIVAITTIVCVVPFMMNAMLGLRSVDRATQRKQRDRPSATRRHQPSPRQPRRHACGTRYAAPRPGRARCPQASSPSPICL